MKMKGKGLLNCAAALTAAALLLTGCGGGKSNETADDYTLDWYLVTGSVPASTEEVEAEVNKYIKDKVGAKLKMHYLDWGAYDQKINVMVAGGDKFDICYTQGDVYSAHVAKNAYLPLNDLMDQYAPKTKEIIGEDFLKGSQINGVNYGIPANKDKGHHQGLMYRTDIAEELGLTARLDSAKSMEDIYPILDIVKEKRKDIAPLNEEGVFSESALINIDNIAFPACFLIGENGEVGEVKNFVELPEYAAACERTYQNRLKGYTRLGYEGKNEKYFIGFAGLKPGKDKESSQGARYDYTQIDITTPIMANQDATGSLMAISRTSKSPEKAMKFLELLNTDPYLNNLIVFGIEGKNYEKLDENTIRPIKDSGYGNSGMQWEFGNTFINYLTEGEDPDKVAKMEKYNEELVPIESLGFSFNSDAVKTEVGACANIRDEFRDTLATGSNPPKPILDEYIAKLKSAGADKIVAEAQRQYDEWKAKNGK